MKIPFLSRGLDAAGARRLIERFLDGYTTPAQEKILYRYFATHSSLSEDLEQYRGMFGWYAAMSPAVSRRSYRPVAAAAAALALLVVAGVAVFNIRHTADSSVYASYRGSYIMSGGQRIDDIQAIYSRLAAAEQFADSLADVADREARGIERVSQEYAVGCDLADYYDADKLIEMYEKNI